MVYLDNITDAQAVFIPRSGSASGGSLAFRLFSTVDRRSYFDARVSDLGPSDLYWRLAVTLPQGCPEGSYEYSLTEDGEEVDCGTAMVGSPEPGPKEYIKQTEYGQYREYGA